MKPLKPKDALDWMRRESKPYRLAPGLYLTPQKRADGLRWIALLRWTLNGTADNKSLGAYDSSQHAHYLAEAARCRDATRQGLDPHTALDGGGAAPGTFAEAAEDFITTQIEGRVANKGGSRKNADNAARCIRRSCTTLGHLQLTAIGPKDIRRALAPRWQRVPSARTALRRIASVIDYGFTLAQIFDRANPAEWKRAQRFMPPQPDHVTKHHKALDADAVPACFRELADTARSGYRGCARDALRCAILTATRSDEVRQMQWDDVDFDARLWTVPKGRIKGRKVHVVPLSDAVIALLREQEKYRRGPYVFQGQIDGKSLSVNAMRLAMLRTSYAGLGTPHGFRTSFYAWYRKPEIEAKFRQAVVDDALAHVREDKEEKRATSQVTRAYDRAEMLDERRALMEAWAHFVTARRRPPLRLAA